jgi:aryl-alcohol dehydrogenase-like predicted oxidoreductase
MNRICLGTVQFGLDYGINNTKGKPSKESVFNILDYAITNNINMFDTAQVYGDAEKVLGEYILNTNGNKMNIISKISNKEQNIQECIYNTLNNLNVSSIDGCLLHNPDDLYNKSIIRGLYGCKRQGIVKNIGVSIYNTVDAINACNNSVVDYIQIPYNILDQRLLMGDFFELAKKNNKTIFARSPFLQGLMFMDEDNIPNKLHPIKKYLTDMKDILKKYHVKLLDGMLQYVLSETNIDYIVFGVETKNQLIECINAYNSKVPIECINELKGRYININEKLISPNMW